MVSAIQNSSDALLQLRDAVVQRDGNIILKIDNLEIAEGESVAVLGPNGSGKSTLVNLLTREVLPLHTDAQPPVLFRGNARPVLEEMKREIGVVSASMQKQIATNLTAVEVVEGGIFGSLGRPLRFEKVAEKAGISRAEAHKRALSALALVGIEDLAGRDMRTLSSGQARRVLIARALIHNPSVIVFDEPCTGLDPEGMYYVRKTMSELAAAEKSVILVTHYPEDVVPEIGRVLFLKNGAIVRDSTREEALQPSELSALFNIPESFWLAHPVAP